MHCGAGGTDKGRDMSVRHELALSIPVPDQLTSPQEPLKVAEKFASLFGREPSGRVLLRWRGDFWYWYGSSWRLVEAEAAQQWIYHFAQRARYVVGKNDDGTPIYRYWAPDKAKVAKVL